MNRFVRSALIFATLVLFFAVSVPVVAMAATTKTYVDSATGWSRSVVKNSAGKTTSVKNVSSDDAVDFIGVFYEAPSGTYTYYKDGTVAIDKAGEYSYITWYYDSKAGTCTSAAEFDGMLVKAVCLYDETCPYMRLVSYLLAYDDVVVDTIDVEWDGLESTATESMYEDGELVCVQTTHRSMMDVLDGTISTYEEGDLVKKISYSNVGADTEVASILGLDYPTGAIATYSGSDELETVNVSFDESGRLIVSYTNAAEIIDVSCMLSAIDGTLFVSEADYTNGDVTSMRQLETDQFTVATADGLSITLDDGLSLAIGFDWLYDGVVEPATYFSTVVCSMPALESEFPVYALVILDGAGAVFDGSSALTFQTNLTDASVDAVCVNGASVDASCYSISGDPVSVTLTQDYLATLEPGEYQVRIESGGNSVQTTFTIAEPVKSEVEVTRVTMHRMYNPNSGEHFYTANTAEKDSLVKAGWKYEGTGWIAPSTSSTPVYRLYSGTDHHYTTSETERDSLIAAGWKYEGIGWYSDDAKGVPLYRQYNPNVQPTAKRNNSGSHNYTTSLAENASLVKAGWKAEGIGWYGLAD